VFRDVAVSTDRPILSANLFFLDDVRRKVHLKIVGGQLKWTCSIKNLLCASQSPYHPQVAKTHSIGRKEFTIKCRL
jgi:hypothetical protein